MIVFPNAKINLGLQVLRRRADGYHDISTVMLPVDWCDILEITPAQGLDGSFVQCGDVPPCAAADNIVLKALKALEKHLGYALPPLDIILEKHIPHGAGMGGGSADASFALKAVDSLLGLNLGDAVLAAIAAGIGADCPFFIHNRPMLAEGIGERLSPVDATALNGLNLVLAKPVSAAVSTGVAYAALTPRGNGATPAVISIDGLRCGMYINDFQAPIEAMRPEIGRVRRHLSDHGAVYAAMTGSGAAVFGFFDNAKMADRAADSLAGCAVHVQHNLRFDP